MVHVSLTIFYYFIVMTMIPASLSILLYSGDDLGQIDTNGNFWDLGNYKMVLKRINNGAKLCDELVKLMNER